MRANMINMRRIHVMAFCLLGMSVELCTATPIDSRAAKICREELTPLMKAPLAKRKLSDAQVVRFIEMAKIDSDNVRQCVCLALAFAQDPNSLEVLKTLSKDRLKGVQAAANYALKVGPENKCKSRGKVENVRPLIVDHVFEIINKPE